MTHIQQRRDESAIWTSENPVLFDGEAGHESDTGKWKLGDGVTAWTALPYKGGVDSVNGETGAVTGLAPLASPVFTGSPETPTPSLGAGDERIVNAEWVNGQEFAPLESPNFTGTPLVPVQPTDAHDDSVVNTAWVRNQNFATTEVVDDAVTLGTSVTTAGLGPRVYGGGPMATLAIEIGVSATITAGAVILTVPEEYWPIRRFYFNVSGGRLFYISPDGTVKATADTLASAVDGSITYPRVIL